MAEGKLTSNNYFSFIKTRCLIHKINIHNFINVQLVRGFPGPDFTQHWANVTYPLYWTNWQK